MSVDGEAVRTTAETETAVEADEPGWKVDPDDEWGVAVLAGRGGAHGCRPDGPAIDL
jgi:hypothetical protein